MTFPVDNSLHQTQQVALSEALTTTPTQLRDRLERESEAKQHHLNSTEVGHAYAIFGFLLFLLLCSQDEDKGELPDDSMKEEHLLPFIHTYIVPRLYTV